MNRDFLRSLIAATILIVLVGLVFGRTLGFEFTNYDDPNVVVDNPVIEGMTLDHVRAVFTEIRDDAYLPLYYASYWIDYAFFKKSPSGYHAMNVLWHALAVVLAFRLARRIGCNELSAFVAAAVFACHPTIVESVAWVASRKELVATVFLLSGLIAYARGFTTKKTRDLIILPTVCVVLGMFAKAVIMTAPIFAWLIAMRFRDRTAGDADLGRRSRRGLAVLSIATIVVVAIHFAIARHTGTAVIGGESTLARAASMLGVFAQYVMNLVFPTGLSVHYDRILDGSFGVREAHGLFLLVVVVAVLALRRLRTSAIAFGALWVAAALIPFNNVFPRFSIAMADRYLYTAALGYGFFVAALIERFAKRPLVAAIVASVIIAGLGATAWSRTAVWKTSETLWRDAIEKSPKAMLPRLQLGHALEWRTLTAPAGDVEAALNEARTLYEQGLKNARGTTEEIQALMKTAGLETRTGRYAAALISFDRLEALLPKAAVPVSTADRDTLRVTRASAHAALGEYQKARAEIARVSPESPSIREARNLDGVIDYLESESMTKKDETPDERKARRALMESALAKFENAIAARRDDKKSRIDRVKTLLAADWIPNHLITATVEVDRLVVDYPDDPSARILRAQIYVDVDPKKAVKDIDFALARDPHREDWYILLSDYLRKVGENRKAIAVLEEGKRRMPESKALIRAVATTFLSFGYHHKNTGEPDLALEFAKRAFDVDPTLVDALVLEGEIHENEALAKEKNAKVSQAHWESARVAFTRAHAIDIGNARAGAGLAHYYRALGYGYLFEATKKTTTEAMKDDLRTKQYEAWQKAIEYSPKDESVATLRELLHAHGVDLAEQARRAVENLEAEKARKSVDLAMKYAPNDVAVLEALAEVETAAGRYPEAKAAWRALLAQDPKDLRSLYELGTLESDDREWAKAREHFEKFAVYAKLDPSRDRLAAQIEAAEKQLARIAELEKAEKK